MIFVETDSLHVYQQIQQFSSGFDMVVLPPGCRVISNAPFGIEETLGGYTYKCWGETRDDVIAMAKMFHKGSPGDAFDHLVAVRTLIDPPESAWVKESQSDKNREATEENFRRVMDYCRQSVVASDPISTIRHHMTHQMAVAMDRLIMAALPPRQLEESDDGMTWSSVPANSTAVKKYCRDRSADGSIGPTWLNPCSQPVDPPPPVIKFREFL